MHYRLQPPHPPSPPSGGEENEGKTMSLAAEKTAPANVLDVANIEVIYNHVILVLKGVSLSVPAGAIVALLGANGAGKSTTLKAISNLLLSERGQVTKGRILCRGERVDGRTPHDLALRYAHYGYILENGRVVLDGDAASLRENEDVKEFYLGIGGEGRRSFRDVKHYRRRKRWL